MTIESNDNQLNGKNTLICYMHLNEKIIFTNRRKKYFILIIYIKILSTYLSRSYDLRNN